MNSNTRYYRKELCTSALSVSARLNMYMPSRNGTIQGWWGEFVKKLLFEIGPEKRVSFERNIKKDYFQLIVDDFNPFEKFGDPHVYEDDRRTLDLFLTFTCGVVRGYSEFEGEMIGGMPVLNACSRQMVLQINGKSLVYEKQKKGDLGIIYMSIRDVKSPDFVLRAYPDPTMLDGTEPQQEWVKKSRDCSTPSWSFVMRTINEGKETSTLDWFESIDESQWMKPYEYTPKILSAFKSAKSG